jgi:cation:H+ antiporter
MPDPRKSLPILISIIFTLPGITLSSLTFLHILPSPLDPPIYATLSGLAILSASFLLLWACDAAQADISASLALAFVALVAVLPEYAVDMYFTWEAGKHPLSHYASYSVANMTGANRLLIGVAWCVIALIVWLKTRKPVQIEKDRRTEIVFLCIATIYAFLIPFKNSLAWYDGIVFLGIYITYMIVTSKRPACECEARGPAEILINLPKKKRRIGTAALFLFAAFAVLANAESFSEGLIGTGRMFHVSEFLLVQWLAPIASEMPEFVVAIMFALRGGGGMALGSLLSAKLNQWTLLVGMIPGVYAVSHGSLNQSIPLNSLQMHEILLTAAQSLLGVVILANLRLTIGQGLLLLWLFIGQFLAPVIKSNFPFLIPWGLSGDQVHQLFALIYAVTSAALLLDYPGRLNYLRRPFSCECDRNEKDG